MSFADILAIESVIAFEEHLCAHSDEMPICTVKKFDLAVTYATFSFFGGCLIMAVLDFVVHRMMHSFTGKGKEIDIRPATVKITGKVMHATHSVCCVLHMGCHSSNQQLQLQQFIQSDCTIITRVWGIGFGIASVEIGCKPAF